MKRASLALWVVFAVAAIALLGFGRYRSKPQLEPGSRAREEAVAIEVATPLATSNQGAIRQAETAGPAAALRVPAPRANSLPNEERLMDALRKAGPGDPQLALQLAREGNARFPTSADVPERQWYAIRALVDSGNLLEATAAARVFVDAFPKNPFANDVARHLLTHPLTHPTEIGYAN
ncbi:MAG: hypothetical protein EOO73_07645 [Myxococcales bacterium]|nr:MAG: hypothetical protein EOO73_07645 [Myxococcales bacterium]